MEFKDPNEKEWEKNENDLSNDKKRKKLYFLITAAVLVCIVSTVGVIALGKNHDVQNEPTEPVINVPTTTKLPVKPNEEVPPIVVEKNDEQDTSSVTTTTQKPVEIPVITTTKPAVTTTPIVTQPVVTTTKPAVTTTPIVTQPVVTTTQPEVSTQPQTTTQKPTNTNNDDLSNFRENSKNAINGMQQGGGISDNTKGNGEIWGH